MNVEHINSPAAPPPARRAARSRHRTVPVSAASSLSTVARNLVGPERRQNMIAEAAYYRAQRRNFEPGYELDDWLDAEAEIDAALTIGLPV